MIYEQFMILNPKTQTSVSIVFFVADLEFMFFLHVDFEQHEKMYK